MLSDTDLMLHLHVVRESMSSHGVRARLDFQSLKLELLGQGRRVELLPQFSFRRNNRLGYTPRLLPEVRGFIGWRPYFNRVWPASVDKVVFKRHCIEEKLSTPQRFSAASDVSTAVLIKRGRSSFGMGMIGPLTPAMLSATKHVLQEGEFLEEFIVGDIAKIWYWNDLPAAMRVVSMPSVVGNGVATVRELIRKKGAPSEIVENQGELDVWRTVVEFQGLSLDDVLPDGQRLIVDYRYQSTLSIAKEDHVEYVATDHSDVQQQLVAAGPVFLKTIPQEIRVNTLYTIDAIVDRNKRVWFLEMNCNPAVHPNLYRPMFESFFGSPQRRTTTLLHSATHSIH